MNRNKILFHTILIFAVLFCFVLDAHTNYNFPTFSIELSNEENNPANNTLSDVDCCDDDKIYSSNESFSLTEVMHYYIVPHECFLVLKHSYSIWQPPKI